MIDFVDSILIDKLIPLDEKFMSDFYHIYLNTLGCEYPDNIYDTLKSFIKYEYSNIEIEELLDIILINISKYINCYNINKKYLIYINNKWIEFRFNEVIEFLKYFIIGIIFDNITKEYKEIKNCRSRDMYYLIHNIYNTFTYNIGSSYFEKYINIYDKKKCIELLLKE